MKNKESHIPLLEKLSSHGLTKETINSINKSFYEYLTSEVKTKSEIINNLCVLIKEDIDDDKILKKLNIID